MDGKRKIYGMPAIHEMRGYLEYLDTWGREIHGVSGIVTISDVGRLGYLGSSGIHDGALGLAVPGIHLGFLGYM